ncbi:DUF3006 domain-containing protein [Mesobacillus maritimus]|uniref:DUF3006 domain-containing protein n=1 Tax=Mesobacillus maritimus TaxID=1643336 RepID=UPI0020425E7A|nr:DUF3006 domain-containing protein [Mesobacillus maritimus]MCM3668565.1 DUF3006 domain-containing protein [Mesobacillus maritimus]
MKGYIDRFEDNGFAVILVEEFNEEFVVSRERLPEGSTVHSYLDVTIEKNQISSMRLDSRVTQSEQKKVDDLMSKIRSKNKGSKFKKK